MSDQHDRNRQVIEAFRAHGGKVGGYFADKDLFLLTTTERKAGSHASSHWPLSQTGSV